MANRLAAVLYRLETASGATNREDLVSNVERLRVLVETLEQQLGIEGAAEDTSNANEKTAANADASTSRLDAHTTKSTEPAVGAVISSSAARNDDPSPQNAGAKASPSKGCCTLL